MRHRRRDRSPYSLQSRGARSAHLTPSGRSIPGGLATDLVHPTSLPPLPFPSHCVCACVTGPVARSRTTGSSHENISVQTPMPGLPDLGEIFSEQAAGQPRAAPLQRGRPAMAECVLHACGRCPSVGRPRACVWSPGRGAAACRGRQSGNGMIFWHERWCACA